MAETSSLLNCRTGSRTGGSNPPASALIKLLKNQWSIHLMVRIQDSQSWHRGSIPLSTTKKGFSTLVLRSFFLCLLVFSFHQRLELHLPCLLQIKLICGNAVTFRGYLNLGKRNTDVWAENVTAKIIKDGKNKLLLTVEQCPIAEWIQQQLKQNSQKQQIEEKILSNSQHFKL